MAAGGTFFSFAGQKCLLCVEDERWTTNVSLLSWPSERNIAGQFLRPTGLFLLYGKSLLKSRWGSGTDKIPMRTKSAIGSGSGHPVLTRLEYNSKVIRVVYHPGVRGRPYACFLFDVVTSRHDGLYLLRPAQLRAEGIHMLAFIFFNQSSPLKKEKKRKRTLCSFFLSCWLCLTNEEHRHTQHPTAQHPTQYRCG